MKFENYVEKLKDRFQALELTMIENPSFTVQDITRICGKIYVIVDDLRMVREYGEEDENGDIEYQGMVWTKIKEIEDEYL